MLLQYVIFQSWGIKTICYLLLDPSMKSLLLVFWDALFCTLIHKFCNCGRHEFRRIAVRKCRAVSSSRGPASFARTFILLLYFSVRGMGKFNFGVSRFSHTTSMILDMRNNNNNNNRNSGIKFVSIV